MNNNRPKVSVCIPSYNYADYISYAIESVISQTYENIELIIIDDCSLDNTDEVVSKYLSIDKRISYYKNDNNVGMVANWNLCLQKASGDYVKILCADDLLEPDCIEKCVKVFADNPTVTVVASARLLIDKDSNPIGSLAFSCKYQLMPGPRVIRKCFFAGNVIGEPTAILFRKKDCKRLFNANYKQLTDLEMWFYLLEQGDFAFLPEKLCKFRRHEEQTTLRNVSSLTFIDDEILLHDDYINKSYIGKTFINEQKWKFQLTYNIWYHKNSGLDKKTINAKIAEYYPLYLFYFLLFIRININRIKYVNSLVKKAVHGQAKLL